MTFADRCEAAFLGLALGDAYGRPLEFVTGDRVYHQPVSLDRLVWTDDTHMALYLAEALLSVDPYEPDAFGAAWSRELVAWLRDPLTPSTAPGNTCLAGARAISAGTHWKHSGVRRSDGCGAVMRIAPLPMALTGDALTEAARISAIATHAHPNALEAAVAGCHILRVLLEGGSLEDGVARAVDVLEARRLGGTVVRSMREGMAHPADGFLEEDTVHPGDGGWRSGSALGLALAALVREDFVHVIDRGARIEGDSDSVACLAGMFAGARDGTVPAELVAVVDEADRIRSLAKRLCARRDTGL